MALEAAGDAECCMNWSCNRSLVRAVRSWEVKLVREVLYIYL